MSANSIASAPDSGTPERPTLDRRTFLGAVGLTASAVMAAAVAPLAAHSTDRPAPLESGAGLAGSGSGAEGMADAPWDVDDMWGHRPRYAHPIPYAHGIPGGGPLESAGPSSVIA
ncbi:MAG: hypothetical protein ACREU3_02575 [Steroidobacteraceae bacterium]